MATYIELKEQAARLLAEAEDMRRIEVTAAIADIKEKMATYGLTLQDLGRVSAPNSGTKAPTPAKYRGPNGQLWSGGRGKKPAWVYEALKAGKDLEEFAI